MVVCFCTTKALLSTSSQKKFQCGIKTTVLVSEIMKAVKSWHLPFNKVALAALEKRKLIINLSGRSFYEWLSVCGRIVNHFYRAFTSDIRLAIKLLCSRIDSWNKMHQSAVIMWVYMHSCYLAMMHQFIFSNEQLIHSKGKPKITVFNFLLTINNATNSKFLLGKRKNASPIIVNPEDL